MLLGVDGVCVISHGSSSNEGDHERRAAWPYDMVATRTSSATIRAAVEPVGFAR